MELTYAVSYAHTCTIVVKAGFRMRAIVLVKKYIEKLGYKVKGYPIVRVIQ